MGRKIKDFEEVRTSRMQYIEDALASLGGSATFGDIAAVCRTKGGYGLARCVLLWLEQDGRVKWDRETGMVFLVDATVDDIVVEENVKS